MHNNFWKINIHYLSKQYLIYFVSVLSSLLSFQNIYCRKKETQVHDINKLVMQMF